MFQSLSTERRIREQADQKSDPSLTPDYQMLRHPVPGDEPHRFRARYLLLRCKLVRAREHVGSADWGGEPIASNGRKTQLATLCFETRLRMSKIKPYIRNFLTGTLISVLSLTSSTSFANGHEHNQQVMTDVGGFALNSVLIEPDGKGELPPIVFIHGASTNLLDPMFSFRDSLQGRAKLLFIDRPGHGSSQSGGPQNNLPDGQADAISRLMVQRGVPKAIVVSHSYGGAVAAALAMKHPEMVIGLVFLSPALYPWKGGIAWYYQAASNPVLGTLFNMLVVPVVGRLAMDSATRSVFDPNPTPNDYAEKTKALQALRPANFKHNAEEIVQLSGWAEQSSKGYKGIAAPSVIITGDADKIVSPDIHSKALATALPNARLFVVHGLGHKSDFVAKDLAIAAIETIAGAKRDLNAIARQVEREIAASPK